MNESVFGTGGGRILKRMENFIEDEEKNVSINKHENWCWTMKMTERTLTFGWNMKMMGEMEMIVESFLWTEEEEKRTKTNEKRTQNT